MLLLIERNLSNERNEGGNCDRQQAHFSEDVSCARCCSFKKK